MTGEELEQIRSIVREETSGVRHEIAGVEQRLLERQDGIKGGIAAVEQRLLERQDRAVESVISSISDLRSEMISEFAEVDRRFTRIDQRLDRGENLSYSLNMQTAGMNKAINDEQRFSGDPAAQIAAQQRSIGDIYQQIAEIKRKLPQ